MQKRGFDVQGMDIYKKLSEISLFYDRRFSTNF